MPSTATMPHTKRPVRPHHPPAHHRDVDDETTPLWKRPWIWLVMLLLVGLGAGAYFTKMTGEDAPDQPTEIEKLIDQVHAAADGWVEGANAYGGTIKSNGQKGATVTGIPSKACVAAGLALAKDGLITINGVMPPRVSAGKLAVLCAQSSDQGATLMWTKK